MLGRWCTTPPSAARRGGRRQPGGGTAWHPRCRRTAASARGGAPSLRRRSPHCRRRRQTCGSWGTCSLQGVSERAVGITCPAVVWLPALVAIRARCPAGLEQPQWAAQAPALLAADSVQTGKSCSITRAQGSIGPDKWGRYVRSPSCSPMMPVTGSARGWITLNAELSLCVCVCVCACVRACVWSMGNACAVEQLSRVTAATVP